MMLRVKWFRGAHQSKAASDLHSWRFFDVLEALTRLVLSILATEIAADKKIYILTDTGGRSFGSCPKWML
jgi:hypothetical protein